MQYIHNKKNLRILKVLERKERALKDVQLSNSNAISVKNSIGNQYQLS